MNHQSSTSCIICSASPTSAVELHLSWAWWPFRDLKTSGNADDGKSSARAAKTEFKYDKWTHDCNFGSTIQNTSPSTLCPSSSLRGFGLIKHLLGTEKLWTIYFLALMRISCRDISYLVCLVVACRKIIRFVYKLVFILSISYFQAQYLNTF